MKYWTLFFSFGLIVTGSLSAQERLEDFENKTVMVFAPHPDDDTFAAGGTLALLAKSNRVIVVLYTNGNKGSYDQEMTSERLARIRKAEETAACGALGIPPENIIWMGYDDGELEYVPPKLLCGQAAKLIRQYRPDALLTIDPGEHYERYHKTDHRMAAFNTVDAIRAAEFHLYYPEHLLVDKLQPFKVPQVYYYFSRAEDANYWVNIDATFEAKLEAASKHVSQFPPSSLKYSPDVDLTALERLKAMFRNRHEKKDDHYVESFRLVTSGYNR